MIRIVATLSPVYVTGLWALVFLFSSKRKNRAKYFLGYFMLVSFLLYLGHCLFFNGLFEIYIHYDPVYIAASLMVYPMYYHYIRLLTYDDKYTRNYLIHYIPAALFLMAGYVLHTWFHGGIHPDTEAFFKNSYHFPDLKSEFLANQVYYFTHRLVFAVQVAFYLAGGYTLIRKHRERILHYYSNQEERNITWVAVVFYSLLVTSLVSFVFNIIGKFTFYANEEALLIPSVLFSVLLFILGFLGNGQDQLVKKMKMDETAYHKTDLKVGSPDEIRQKLEKLLSTEKIYLNDDLNIWQMAAMVGTNRTYLSDFINKNFGQNFSMYVNHFRVQEAKQMLSNPVWDKYSLESVGEKCGFGSYNNFIRVFREFEKVTPGRYRDNCRQHASG